MANYKLNYVGVLWAICERMGSDCDQVVSDLDDGFNSTVEDGKGEVKYHAAAFIQTLNEFIADVDRLSYKQLEAKYG